MEVIRNNAIPPFVALLNSPSADVREQSVWALANIAGESMLATYFFLKQQQSITVIIITVNNSYNNNSQ